MNTHDDLLNNDEMCSFYEDDIENMCSNKEYDTCGDSGSFIPQKSRQFYQCKNGV